MDITIRSWRKFSTKVRRTGMPMLQECSRLNNPVFVTGCQRSGTTILTDVLLSSDEYQDYRSNIIPDSELMGALILSNKINYNIDTNKRCCFQTTYLNERFYEYQDLCNQFKMIFVLRNPYSVVYSMVYNWIRRREVINFPLNELFQGCATQLMSNSEQLRYKFFGTFGISRIKKGILSYIGKVSQASLLKELFDDDVIIIDYDDLVGKKELVLPYIFDFIGSKYKVEYGRLIRSSSINKFSKLSQAQMELVDTHCEDVYLEIKELAVRF